MAWGRGATASGRRGESVTAGRAGGAAEGRDRFGSALQWVVWTIGARQGVLTLSWRMHRPGLPKSLFQSHVKVPTGRDLLGLQTNQLRARPKARSGLRPARRRREQARLSVCPSQVSAEMQRDVLRRLFQTDPDVIDYLLRRKSSATP